MIVRGRSKRRDAARAFKNSLKINKKRGGCQIRHVGRIWVTALIKQLVYDKCSWKLVYRVFCVAYHESSIRFQKLQMADPIWRPKIFKIFKFHKNWDIGVFWVTDYGSAISFSKFKVADPIWQPKIFKITQILWKLGYKGFLGLWLWICY